MGAFLLPMALGAAKGLLGLGQTIFGSKIKPQFSQYQESDYAKNQLGIAQQLFNGRMAGATNQERNIYGTQANALDSVGRNATDSSQALAMAGSIQGNTNDAFNQLGTTEAQNKYSLLDNLNRGYQAMVTEGDKVQQSKMQKYLQDMEARTKMMNGGISNMFSGLSDMASFGYMKNQMGAGGGSGRGGVPAGGSAWG